MGCSFLKKDREVVKLSTYFFNLEMCIFVRCPVREFENPSHFSPISFVARRKSSMPFSKKTGYFKSMHNENVGFDEEVKYENMEET